MIDNNPSPVTVLMPVQSVGSYKHCGSIPHSPPNLGSKPVGQALVTPTTGKTTPAHSNGPFCSRSRFVVNDPKIAEFVSKSVGSTDCQCHTALGIEEDGEIIVGALLDNVTGSNAFIHFSVAPRRSIPRSFLRWLFGYCFNGLKLKRVSAAFSSANKKVKRLGEFIGFEPEAVLKDGQPDGDTLIWCLRKEQCRFLV